MPRSVSASRLRPSRGARIGIILGGAIALVGIGVGGAMGVSPSNPVVYVGNTAASPVPVTLQGTGTISGDVNSAQKGTWNVGITGTPTVNVGNFPASGSVKIAPATEIFGTGRISLSDSGGNIAKPFGKTINVTAIGLGNTDGIDPFNDTIEVLLATSAGPFVPVRIGDGSAFITFTQPIPATQINFACLNDVLDCDFYATVVGY
jgi:hypothetical protein